jgi:hypothetical protein
MGSRLVLALVAAVAIVAVGGIGFAAFTSVAYVNGTGTAANVGPLTWNDYTAGSGTDGATCSTSSSSPYTTLTLTVNGLIPGGSCNVMPTLYNGGGYPLTLATSASGWSVVANPNSGNCNDFDYSDASGIDTGSSVTTGSGSIGASTSAPYSVTISLGSGAGNTDQGLSCSLTVTITGTAT